MYDNLDLYCPQPLVSKTDLLNTIPQHFTQWGTSGESEFGHYITGYLDNLKVKVTERGVKVYDSSICKYYLKTNFKTLGRGDTKMAIESISDRLHLPFDRSKIHRIDFAQNMIMKHPESVYLPYLGESQYYTRQPQNNGLYYNLKTGKRQLLFYGKEYEQKVKKQPIPEMYKDRNVLRFEMRFKKRIPEQLNRPEVIGSTLYDESFYYDLMRRWRDEYLNIQKIQLSNMKPTGSTKELFNEFALQSILDKGQADVLAMIKEWQETKQITRKQALDHRRKIKELCSQNRPDAMNEYIQELDKKIRQAARI